MFGIKSHKFSFLFFLLFFSFFFLPSCLPRSFFLSFFLFFRYKTQKAKGFDKYILWSIHLNCHHLFQTSSLEFVRNIMNIFITGKTGYNWRLNKYLLDYFLHPWYWNIIGVYHSIGISHSFAVELRLQKRKKDTKIVGRRTKTWDYSRKKSFNYFF